MGVVVCNSSDFIGFLPY